MDRSESDGAESGMEGTADAGMKGTMSGHLIIVAANDQVSCDLDGETVILSLKNKMYYGLESVGARIWNLIQTPTTVGEIRDTLVNEYEVEPDRCERDLLLLLDELAAKGLVEVKEETPASIQAPTMAQACSAEDGGDRASRDQA